jgi:hypothetical protein
MVATAWYVPENFLEIWKSINLPSDLYREIMRQRPRYMGVLEVISRFPNGATFGDIMRYYNEPSDERRRIYVNKVRKIALTLSELLHYNLIRKVEFTWKWIDRLGNVNYTEKHPAELGYEFKKAVQVRKPLYFLGEKAKKWYDTWGIWAPPWLIYKVLKENGYFKEKKEEVEEIRMEKGGELLEEFKI